MYPYIPGTNEDKNKMLEIIGLNSMDELFSDIPEELRLNRALNLPKSKSELEVGKIFAELSNKNLTTSNAACFLGAGAYDHYIPHIVGHILSRSEFYTAYTPYQPEISQGTLQYIFEFQSLICRLTGMDVANASLYDGGTAVVEAALMAVATTKKDEIVISKSVKPDSLRVLKTYAHQQNLKVIEVETKEGETDYDDLKAKVNDNTAAVIIQSPNFFGIIENLEEATKAARLGKKAVMIASVDPISLAIMKKPAEYDVDVVVGEAQGMGIPLAFGGPYLGFIATKDKYMRKIPGRIVGETIDKNGKRAYVLTLTAREQHIRREKATSNICSNQGVNVLAATVYMVTLGKEGLKEVATQCVQKAHYLKEKMIASGKYKLVFNKPFFKEFAVKSDIPVKKINEELRENMIIGGYDLGSAYPQLDNCALYAVTEKRTKEEMDKLVNVLEGIK